MEDTDNIVSEPTAAINAPDENPNPDKEIENEIEKETVAGDSERKLAQLPLARIRNLMKLDPEKKIASHEAVLAVTLATQYFIESLAQEAFVQTTQQKKKTINKQNVETAISLIDSLMFLDGALDYL